MIVYGYRTFNLVVIILTSSFFFGIFFHIVIKDFEDWENNKYFDVYNAYVTFYTYDLYQLQDDDPGFSPQKSLVKMWYYGITTLSTIGFGDFSPKSTLEKFLISIVMMFGVSIFSYIMGNFIEILINYKKLDNIGDPRELSKWISLLTKYNES